MSHYLKVSTKKWSGQKSKHVDYFKMISIPGVSQILTTESYLIKLLWTVVVLCVFGLGFENISLAVGVYYKFDNFTNIEGVNPENVTFTAITICSVERNSKEHNKNRKLIKRDLDIT